MNTLFPTVILVVNEILVSSLRATNILGGKYFKQVLGKISLDDKF